MAWDIDASISIHEAVYVAFDFETTGLNSDVDDIVEIGAVKFTSSSIIEEFSTLIKPQKKMTDEVISVHNITNEMVEKAPKISEKIESFYKLLEGSILMAHNLSFDFKFLNAALFACGMETLQKAPSIDTMHVAKNVSRSNRVNYPNHKLQTLAEYYNIPCGDAHRALDDAHTCRQVFFKCAQEMSILGELEVSRVLL